MEINQLMSAVEKNLRAAIAYNPRVDICPSNLRDNTPDEIEFAITNTYKMLIQMRIGKDDYEDIKNTEIAEKIRTVAMWLLGRNYPQKRFGLILQGICGNGKSTLSMAIYKVLAAANASVNRVTTEDLHILFAQQLAGMSCAYNEYKTAHRLFLDELGAEPEFCKIYGVDYYPIQSLISYRYDRQLPTIITTNLSDDMIKKRYGERMADRLKEMCSVLKFTSSSYRK